MAKKKDYDYFDKFVELVDYSCKCAEMLHNNIINFDVKTLAKKVTEIHGIEHAADLAKHEMMAQLAKEFIAPIEREDIVNLSQEIDDITDSIEEVLMKIHMFNITVIKPEVLEFTRLIAKCCAALKIALQEFPQYKKSPSSLKEKLIAVDNLEEEGDRLYYRIVRNLYLNSKDPSELFIWTQLYELLEKCCDNCAHTSDIIESVIMKNS